jgi:hypothetical protein
MVCQVIVAAVVTWDLLAGGSTALQGGVGEVLVTLGCQFLQD